jgi:hypothetical protein
MGVYEIYKPVLFLEFYQRKKPVEVKDGMNFQIV